MVVINFFRVTSTYLIFHDSFGLFVDSPVSPILCNIFMEHLEQIAIARAPQNCELIRYVDDCLAILPEHLNKVDFFCSIKCTNEVMVNQQISFLDTNIIKKTDGTIKTTVFRKSTHTQTNIYTLCQNNNTDSKDQTEDEYTIRKALSICGYPEWTTASE